MIIPNVNSHLDDFTWLEKNIAFTNEISKQYMYFAHFWDIGFVYCIQMHEKMSLDFC